MRHCSRDTTRHNNHAEKVTVLVVKYFHYDLSTGERIYSSITTIIWYYILFIRSDRKFSKTKNTIFMTMFLVRKWFFFFFRVRTDCRSYNDSVFSLRLLLLLLILHKNPNRIFHHRVHIISILSSYIVHTLYSHDYIIIRYIVYTRYNVMYKILCDYDMPISRVPTYIRVTRVYKTYNIIIERRMSNYRSAKYTSI